jgi:hypothetical protein
VESVDLIDAAAPFESAGAVEQVSEGRQSAAFCFAAIK